MSEERWDGYRELAAWQLAMDFVSQVYAQTDTWASDEPSGITAQIRSAAVSVPAAIARGHGLSSPAGFALQLRIAYNELVEVETLLKFGSRSNLSSESELEPILGCAARLRRQINELLNSLDLTSPN
jgi:four helix bundle protein